ncbi:MAG: ATP-dependent nuclease, partial [Metamycoplasmataceae bacterium]
MKIGTQEFLNEKGAIIIGLNGSGKSSVLKKIKEDVKKNKIVVEKNNENEEREIIFIDSVDNIGKATEGIRSLVSVKIKQIKEKIVKNNEEILVNLKKSANEEFEEANQQLKMHEKREIFNSGITLNYGLEINNDVNILPSIRFNNIDYDLEKASTGIKALVSLFINGLEGDDISNKVIVIDEIENFLHPEWIELAANLINNLWRKNNIIVLSTHSPLLLTLLMKENPETLSRIERKENRAYGNVITWNYLELKKNVMNIINKKKEIFANFLKTQYKDINMNYSDSYIRSILSEETCNIFFYKNPKIVEGSTEKIYFEQKYNIFLVRAGGFHDYLILDSFLSAFDSEIIPKFLIDHDKGTNKPYNDHVYKKLGEEKIYRYKKEGDDFEIMIHGEKVDDRQKIPKIIDFLISGEEAKNPGELENIEIFFNLEKK